MDWQDIDSFEGEGGGYYLVVVNGETTVGHPWRGTWIDVLNEDREVAPTHWMPLPNAPA